VSGIGKRIAAGVPEHVNVDREAYLGLSAQALDVTVQGIGRERRAALAGENKLGVRALIAPQCANRTNVLEPISPTKVRMPACPADEGLRDEVSDREGIGIA
jgi:hypothetical protein